MSHKKTIICPNCGHKAPDNYCAQCGQQTHLHDETFRGLVVHFFAHYFHYESKFWQTIKTLLTKPGALTVAYRQKQRMRYVPPMSLYIFIVIGYFIFSSLLTSVYNKLDITGESSQEKYSFRENDTDKKIISVDLPMSAREKFDYVKSHSNDYEEQIIKLLPKVFFFMVPVFALFLSLFFIHRKDLFFIDHVIFSFHLHTVLFFVLLLSDIWPFSFISSVLLFVGFIALLAYSVRAMMVVYTIKPVRAIIYSALAFSMNFLAFCSLLVLAIISLV